jgi:hypothetical protein
MPGGVVEDFTRPEDWPEGWDVTANSDGIASTFITADGRCYVNGQMATPDEYVAAVAASLRDKPDLRAV